jgi:hypothetical protein
MDVNKLVTRKKDDAGSVGRIDARRRRALARLGMVSAGAYVTPTLLALQSTVVSASPAAEIGVAA